jgi:hypothetical protein
MTKNQQATVSQQTTVRPEPVEGLFMVRPLNEPTAHHKQNDIVHHMWCALTPTRLLPTSKDIYS